MSHKPKKTVAVPRLMVAAPRKSSGKTLLSVGLTAALSARGLVVQPFKKGPDFIDPMWLTSASGRPCRTLDFYMLGRQASREAFLTHQAGADLCLIEGNMGLFDGQDPEGGDCGAALAAELAAPVLLLVNCQGLARGVAPLVLGHLNFPGGERIAGIVLNQVASPRHEARLRAALERYCPVPVVGALPREAGVVVDERHLGLVPVGERDDLAERIGAMGELVAAHVDLDRVLELAAAAPPLPVAAQEQPTTAVPAAPAAIRTVPAKPRAPMRIGYAADRAFSFYYPENLEALAALGAELVPFSLVEHQVLPLVDGLFIGGGFPELFMEELAANPGGLAALRRAAAEGTPIYAECGGLMVLAERIHWGARSASMAGVLPIQVTMERKPQGYGYMEIEGTGELPWPPPGERVRCHEFHHSRVVGMGPGVRFAYRVVRGTGVGEGLDGILHGRVLASYAHIHARGAPGWARFLMDFWSGVG